MYVDIYGKKVYVHDLYGTGELTAYSTPGTVGTVAPRKGGGAVIAIETGFAFLDFRDGSIHPIEDPEADKPDNRFNDGKCSPEGRFWAGTMAKQQPHSSAGALYVLDPPNKTQNQQKPQVRKALDGVTVSNGMAWTSDAKTMYYIDSPLRRVDAFDYNSTEGTISNRRVAFSLPEGGIDTPDGCNIDTDGNLWVAHWNGWCVQCHDPNTGAVLVEIQIPTALVSSCAFGGPDLGDLYITTAKHYLSPEEQAKQPLAGAIFLVRNVGARGVPAPEFDG